MKNTILLTSRTEETFSLIPKSVLDERRLSWKAKGILAYLLSKNATLNDLRIRGRDGPDAVRSGLKELRKLGYVVCYSVRDDNGKIIEWEWRVSDAPIFKPECVVK